MAQIKIYGLRESLDKYRKGISESIHQASMDFLGLPAEKKFHRFIALEKENFIFPDDRSENYIIIEVSLFTGRSLDVRKSYIKNIIANLTSKIDISENDIEITLFESPAENWGIRGKCGDELKLNYKVDI